MKPTADNPSGVESFDHSEILRTMPHEYEAARKALNDLAHAVDRRFGQADHRGQTTWLKFVEQMTASLSYADSSGHRGGRDCPAPIGTMWWPYRVEVDDARALCSYCCATCGQQWTKGYALVWGW